VVTAPEISTLLFERAASTDKTLYLYEGAYHAIYFESERVRGFGCAKAWGVWS
jgi:alpha-beta hydrolase superfamily lysophospholipase